MRAVVGIALTVCALAACASGQNEVAPVPEASGSASRAPANSPGAAIEQAMRAFIDDGQGSFTSGVAFPGLGTTRQEGEYDVQSQAGRWRMTLEEGVQEIVLEAISNRREGWVRLVDGPAEWPCWVHLEAKSTGTDLGLPGMAVLGPPSPVAAMLLAKGTTWEGPDVEGTTDLALAAASMSGKFVAALGIPPESNERVSATFHLDGGELVGWSTTMLKIVESSLNAGFEPAPEIPVLSPLTNRRRPTAAWSSTSPSIRMLRSRQLSRRALAG